MDVAFILDRYFKGMSNVSIDVFDAQTLNAVYALQRTAKSIAHPDCR